MKTKKRTHFEYLLQWVIDNPEASRDIALGAIWLLYSEGDGKTVGFLQDPEDVELRSAADFVEHMGYAIKRLGGIDAIKAIRSRNRNKKIPETTHWMVCGRIPGADDDTMAYVKVPEGSTPSYEFITQILYEGDPPKGFLEGRAPTERENIWGTWAYINSEIEIHGPPIKK